MATSCWKKTQHTNPPETLVDEILGTLSKNSNTTTTNDGTNNSGNGNVNGANEKPAGRGEGGGSNTRAALKELASHLNRVLFSLLVDQPAFAELGGVNPGYAIVVENVGGREAREIKSVGEGARVIICFSV